MAASHEDAAMRRALALAAPGPAWPTRTRASAASSSTGRGTVVGEGYHRGAGTAHAEVDALAAAGPAARGGTAVVTLEPCHHCRADRPCTAALLDAGVARVVVGAADPNPLAAGGAEAPARGGSRGRVRRPGDRERRRSTATGCSRCAPAAPSSPGSSPPPSTGAAPRPTARAGGSPARPPAPTSTPAGPRPDAILVGTGTVLADDPQLTVRDADGDARRAPAAAGRPRPTAGAAEHARVLDAQRSDPAPGPPRPGRGPRRAARPRDPPRLARGRSDGRGRVPGGPGSSTRCSPTSPRPCSGRGRPRWRTSGIDTIAGRARLVTTDVRRLGDDMLVVASPQRRPAPPGEPHRKAT